MTSVTDDRCAFDNIRAPQLSFTLFPFHPAKTTTTTAASHESRYVYTSCICTTLAHVKSIMPIKNVGVACYKLG